MERGMCDGRDSDAALELVDRIANLVDDLPERAEEFGEGVMERAQDIGYWISSNQHVTERQMEALQNMLVGMKRWLE